VEKVKEFDSLTSPFTSEFKLSVKYSEAYLYEMKGLGIKKELASRKTEYNEQKQFTSDAFYKVNELESEVTRTFNEKRLIKEIFCLKERIGEPPSFLEDKKQQHELKCFYITVRNNAEGFPLEKRYLRKDSTLGQRVTWLYNVHGKILKCDTYSNSDKLIERLSYSYDANGRMISETNYANDTTVFTMKRCYIYGSNDSLSEMSFFSNNKPHPNLVYKYNTRGNISEEYYYDGPGLLFKNVNVFDDKGYITGKRKLDDKGNINEQIFYLNEYDAEKRLVKRVEKDASGKVLSKKKYTYDEYGNYTRVVTNMNDKHYCLKRKITYYDQKK
jgi:YD repeat-containing protein